MCFSSVKYPVSLCQPVIFYPLNSSLASSDSDWFGSSLGVHLRIFSGSSVARLTQLNPLAVLVYTGICFGWGGGGGGQHGDSSTSQSAQEFRLIEPIVVRSSVRLNFCLEIQIIDNSGNPEHDLKSQVCI